MNYDVLGIAKFIFFELEGVMRNLGFIVSAVSAVGLLLGNGVASAADLPMKAPPIAVVAPPSWTGFYIGGSLGGAGGGRDFVFDTAGTVPLPNPANLKFGAAGAGFVGAQWQWDKIVLGAEASYNLFDLNNSEICPGVTFTCRTSANRAWTVGPRLGVAFDQFMIYGTGGYASVKTGYLATTTATGITFDSADTWVRGWFAGGGVEWMAPSAPGLVVGIDYKHIQTDQQSTQPFTPTGTFLATDHFLMTSHIDTVQLRFSYKFGWTSPLVAKY
jgi:outer membrane immunogenic protein